MVQETYVKALKGFSSFQPDTNFRAWMYRILRNTFLTSRTGLKATSTVPLDEEESPELPASAETPESLFIDRSRRLLQSAIEELLCITRGPAALRCGRDVVRKKYRRRFPFLPGL